MQPVWPCALDNYILYLDFKYFIDILERKDFWFYELRLHCLCASLETVTLGRVRWLKPVIPALWEAEVGGLLEARSLRPTWSTW